MVEYLKDNPTVVAVLLTAMIGFIAWLLKDTVAEPYREAREDAKLNHRKKKDALCEIYNLLLAFCMNPENTQIKEKISSFLISSQASSLNTTICEDLCSVFFGKNELNEVILLTRTKKIRNQIEELIKEEDKQIQKGIGSQSLIGKLLSYFLTGLALVFLLICIPVTFYAIYLLFTISIIYGIVVSVVIAFLLFYHFQTKPKIKEKKKN